MGIFNQSEGTLPYVPPLATGGAAPCTLLGRDRAEVTPIRYEPDAPATSIFGDSAQPAAGQYDDLNRSPATTVELRFRHVRFPGYDTGYDHAFIVATDNATGRQYHPWGYCCLHRRIHEGQVKRLWRILPSGIALSDGRLDRRGKEEARRVFG